MLCEHLKSIILNDPASYQISKAKLEGQDIPLLIEDYMCQYITENSHVLIEKGEKITPSTIEKIVGKYNKNIPIDTAISTYNRKIHEIEIE